MDWIKKNYEKFILLLLSLALLGVSVFLFIAARGFLAGFEPLKQPVTPNNHLPALQTKGLEAAQASLEKPATWSTTNHKNSLFVSLPYVLDESSGLPVPSVGLSQQWKGQPVPAEWFQTNRLDNLNPATLNDDADGDGFMNGDEWEYKTDPNDKNSHPPYYTKLRLEEFIKVKFRVIFQGQPDDDSFQINTLDNGRPSQILKMGETVEGTKFKIMKFEKKIDTDPDSGIEHDNSELTLQSTEPGSDSKVVLIKGRVVDSPDSYAKFKYLWHDAANPETADFTVKKGQTFSIKPEADVTYKLIDIDEKGAKILNLKTNETLSIPHL